MLIPRRSSFIRHTDKEVLRCTKVASQNLESCLQGLLSHSPSSVTIAGALLGPGSSAKAWTTMLYSTSAIRSSRVASVAVALSMAMEVASEPTGQYMTSYRLTSVGGVHVTLTRLPPSSDTRRFLGLPEGTGRREAATAYQLVGWHNEVSCHYGYNCELLTFTGSECIYNRNVKSAFLISQTSTVANIL